jgi:putative ABC transport system ATP-binding protein
MVETAMTILEARGIYKTYVTRGVEAPALLGVDLCIEEGEFSALAGPSGSGKTTLLNLFGALDEPSSGEVILDGQRLADLSAAELSALRLHKLGFVFQAYNLIPVLTARENIEFVMELQAVPKRERRDRANELLEEVGIAEMGDKRPLEMSGGQQQRVAVARAIASRPRVVLADEPTANLDSATAGKLLDLMVRLNTERGVTFLFSTHDARVIDRARRTIRLDDGKIVGDERDG